MARPLSRDELLGQLGERIIDTFRVLQREVTVDRPGLISVTRSEADILRVVLDEPGTTVTEIARAFDQHKSNTSTRVAALVEKGLVRKETGGSDGREVRVVATQLAIDNLAAYRSVWAARLAPATRGDDDERLRVALEVLTEIAEALATRERGDAD